MVPLVGLASILFIFTAALSIAQQERPSSAQAKTNSAKRSATDVKDEAATLPGASLRPAVADESRTVPYSGPMLPSEPPSSAAPPPRPLTADDKNALNKLYKNPSTPGPKPVPRTPAAGISVVGKGQVFRVLPGPHPFPDKVPEELRHAEGHFSAFSNNIATLPGGKVRFASIDRTRNDTSLSKDWMAFDASFKDEEGSQWRGLISGRTDIVYSGFHSDRWRFAMAVSENNAGLHNALDNSIHKVIESGDAAKVFRSYGVGDLLL